MEDVTPTIGHVPHLMCVVAIIANRINPFSRHLAGRPRTRIKNDLLLTKYIPVVRFVPFHYHLYTSDSRNEIYHFVHAPYYRFGRAVKRAKRNYRDVDKMAPEINIILPGRSELEMKLCDFRIAGL